MKKDLEKNTMYSDSSFSHSAWIDHCFTIWHIEPAACAPATRTLANNRACIFVSKFVVNEM
jgi:hypothetical protein